jgi:threonine synthase
LGLGLGLAYDRSAEPKAQLARLARSLDERRAAVAEAAEQVKNHFETEMVQSSLRQAAQGGEPLMWAWDGAEPASAAHGILDDVTYDWYWLALSLLRTGGLAVAVPEASVVRMTEAARASVPAGVSATGASGLAGLARLQEVGAVPASADAVVLLTGAAR